MPNQENPIDKGVRKTVDLFGTSRTVQQIGKGISIPLIIIGVFLAILGFVNVIVNFENQYAWLAGIGGVALYFIGRFLLKKTKANLKNLNKENS